jgi:hypothetical protein
MISPFSGLMDSHVEAQFRKDRSGRVVFIPLKGKGYFVDSKADEARIKTFARKYLNAATLLNFLIFTGIYVPGAILSINLVAPLRTKLGISIGIVSCFLVVYIAAAWMLWSVYKAGIAMATASLEQAGPEVMSHLSATPRQRQQRLAFLSIAAGLILIIGVIFLLASHPHR